jgi:hypothetical protein
MSEEKLDAKGTLRLEEAVRPPNFEIDFSAPSVYRALLVLNSIPPSIVNLIRLAIMDPTAQQKRTLEAGAQEGNRVGIVGSVTLVCKNGVEIELPAYQLQAS